MACRHLLIYLKNVNLHIHFLAVCENLSSMRRVLKPLLLAYIGYLALVILVITPAINYFLPGIYQQQTGRTLHTNGIGINPFTATFFLYHSEDTNASGSVLWSVDELAINVSLASFLGRGVVLDELAVKSLYLHPQKNQDGSWIFEDILRHRAQLAGEEVSPPAEQEVSEKSLPGITIHSINFHAKHLGYSDLARAEPFEAALEDISISLKNFSTLVEEGRPYHLIARDESGGELEWTGTLSVPGQHSEGELHLRKISLMPLWRFIQSDVNFKMHSAFLDMSGNYQLSWADPANPAYHIKEGHLALTDVHISPKSEQESALALKEFAINQISVNSETKQITSSLVEVNAFRGTLSILEDGTTNFQSIFTTPSDTNKNKKPAEVSSAPASPWQVSIDTIKLNDAAFAFNDYSIEPDFKVKIQEFGGEIQPVSTAQNGVTRINLKGNVDGYAPVTLTGDVKPLASPVDLNLAFDFRGIELSSFASYSGTYAGYRINSGLLTVSLQYSLKNNRIHGRNKVVINQLALGERVNSPRLIDLPLRLALALLTDENGVIDLDVEVSGDTENPDFSIGKIILKAFRNLIVKAVTAPFKLLASLVGGDDFEFIAFAAGESILSEEAKSALTKVQEALVKRPQLNLGLSGLYSEEDRYFLKSKALHEQLMADGLSQRDIDEKTSKFKRRINNFYEKKWPEADEDQEAEEKYRQLVNAQPNPEILLEQLRQERAMAVKLFLLQKLGMDAGKVYLDKSLHGERRHAVKLLLESK